MVAAIGQDTDVSMKCGRCQQETGLLFSIDYDDGCAGDRYCRECFASLLDKMSGDLAMKIRCTNVLRRMPYAHC